MNDIRRQLTEQRQQVFKLTREKDDQKRLVRRCRPPQLQPPLLLRAILQHLEGGWATMQAGQLP